MERMFTIRRSAELLYKVPLPLLVKGTAQCKKKKVQCKRGCPLGCTPSLMPPRCNKKSWWSFQEGGINKGAESLSRGVHKGGLPATRMD